jgi:hypothetical protein
MNSKSTTELSIKLPKRLRAKQIAEEFSICLSSVWLYAKQQKITPIKVSPRITVFDTQEVLALFSNSEVHNEK